MKRWSAFSPLVAAVLLACERDPVAVQGVPSVFLTYSASFLAVGDSLLLTSRVLDRNAAVVNGASVQWTSSVPTVASVSPAGMLKGLSAGETVVTVRYGQVTSSASFAVDADPCTGAIALQVGEVRQARGPRGFSCLVLAPATTAQDVLFVVGNARAVQDDTLGFRLSFPGGTAARAAGAFALPGVFDPRAIVQEQQMAAASEVELRLRTFERRMLNGVIDHVRAVRGRSGPGEAEGVSFALSAAVAAPGDTLNIRVPNLQSGKQICRDFIPVRGVVRAVSARATILEDVAQPPGALSQADYTAIAAEFDQTIFPGDTLWFGSPTDLDRDGRVTIFYTPEVNKLTPAGSASIVGGFFFGGDLLRRSDYPADNDCRNQTNEQEIFYMLAPDPNGVVNSNPRTTAGVRQVTRGTIAHELQHMINQSVRQYNPAVKAFETTWLNEALSHFAEEAIGRRVRGFSDGQSLRFADVNPDANNQNDYLAFFRQNLTRFRIWELRPDTSSPTTTRSRDNLGARGAAWALVRYAADQYAGGNQRAFFRRLAAGPETDIPNLLARTGNRPFDEVIGGWLVANYTDGLTIPNLATRYTYPSWDVRDAMSAVNNAVYPLQVNTLPGQFSGQAASGSGLYYLLRRTAGAPQQVLDVRTIGGAPMVSPNARVWMARIN